MTDQALWRLLAHLWYVITLCVCACVTKILVPAMIWHISLTHINTPPRGRGWCVATEVCVCIYSAVTLISLYIPLLALSCFGIFGLSAYHWLRQKSTRRNDGACLRLRSVISSRNSCLYLRRSDSQQTIRDSKGHLSSVSSYNSPSWK